ncbi:MAG: BamA/TamA family outer membrane protein [Fidelibacterota bacterium]
MTMFLKVISLSLSVLVCGRSALGQSGSPGLVTDIKVEGNRVTKDYIIEREIQHPELAPFDSSVAAEDRNRIDNLGIFSDVRFRLEANGDGSHTLIYRVQETWRIFPVPVVLYQEETGWSYGAAVLVKNFRGRNEILQAAGAMGGTVFGALQFENPWIAGDHVSMRAHAYRTVFNHPFLGFSYHETDLEVTLGRYFGYEWKLWVTASVEERMAKFFEKNKDALRHRYFQSKFLLIHDTRDLYIDPSRGIKISGELRPEVGLDGNSPFNAFWEVQASAWRTLVAGPHQWVAGGSVFLHTYTGEGIPYKILMAGGAESIRGWAVLDSASYEGQRFRAGLNMYTATLELRQTLVPKYVTPLGTEFGVILAEFVDLGRAHDDVLSLFQAAPMAGVGVGVRVFIPGAQLLRIDYGIGYYRGSWQSGRWHLSLGHKVYDLSIKLWERDHESRQTA